MDDKFYMLIQLFITLLIIAVMIVACLNDGAGAQEPRPAPTCSSIEGPALRLWLPMVVSYVRPTPVPVRPTGETGVAR